MDRTRGVIENASQLRFIGRGWSMPLLRVESLPTGLVMEFGCVPRREAGWQEEEGWEDTPDVQADGGDARNA
jgi:hypothetical protein